MGLVHLLYEVTVESALLRICAVPCTIEAEATTNSQKSTFHRDSL